MLSCRLAVQFVAGRCRRGKGYAPTPRPAGVQHGYLVLVRLSPNFNNNIANTCWWSEAAVDVVLEGNSIGIQDGWDGDGVV